LLPGDYTFTVGSAGDNGVHVFSNGFRLQTGPSQTITATDTITATITGNATVNVNTANPSDMQLTSITHNALQRNKVGYGKVAPFVVNILNAGPNSASNVVATINWTSAALVSVNPGSGSCGAPAGNSVACNLGTIANGITGVVNLSLRATLGGTVKVNASVYSDSPDPNPANNSNSDAVKVFILPRALH